MGEDRVKEKRLWGERELVAEGEWVLSGFNMVSDWSIFIGCGGFELSSYC